MTLAEAVHMERPTVLPLAGAALRALIVLNWLFGVLILVLLLISFQA